MLRPKSWQEAKLAASLSYEHDILSKIEQRRTTEFYRYEQTRENPRWVRWKLDVSKGLDCQPGRVDAECKLALRLEALASCESAMRPAMR